MYDSKLGHFTNFKVLVPAMSIEKKNVEGLITQACKFYAYWLDFRSSLKFESGLRWKTAADILSTYLAYEQFSISKQTKHMSLRVITVL